MSDEVNIQGKKFVSLSRASDVSGYSADHIKGLCDKGRVSNQNVEGALYIDQMDLMRKRQEDAFGTIRYLSDETPLRPEIVKGNGPTTSLNDVSLPKEKDLPQEPHQEVPKDVDPTLLSGFTVNQFGQKVVALAIALVVVFGAGYALNSRSLKYETEHLSILVNKSVKSAAGNYIDSVASALYSMEEYTPPPISKSTPSVSSTLPSSEINNSAESELSIEIEPDKIAPFIILKGDNPITIYVGDSYDDPGAIIEDNKDKNITYTVSPGVIDTTTPGERDITITARDSDGNVSEATRVVIIK